MSAVAKYSHAFDWFDEQWQLWLQQVRLDHVPNALLLTGAPGIGKFSLGCRFARLLLCQQSGVDEACDICKSCQLNNADSHPDFICIQPDEGSRSVKIDQVRQLTDFVQSKPQISKRRVAILRPAEAMNIYAANAILKTLEEPPGSAVIILISQQASLLLPTIRSRCQIVKLPNPGCQQASQWLARQTGQSLEQAAEILRNAGGQPMTALAWSDSQQITTSQNMQAQWVAFMAGEEDAFTVAASWTKLDTDWVLNWLGGWLRDILRAQRDHSFSVPQELGIVAARLSAETIWRLFQELLAIRKSHQQQRNLNMQLVYEHWLLLNKQKY